ncbi:unnamed protein product [Gordionus sp. m RMFG-2023]
MLQLGEFIQPSEDVCLKRYLSNLNESEIKPDNIPFTLHIMTITDVIDLDTPIRIVSEMFQYENTYVKRYVHYNYYVARVKDNLKSFVFGSLDRGKKDILFDGIIYMTGKMHFVDGGIIWGPKRANKWDMLKTSSLADKWGMSKWELEEKYLYYTEDDIEPRSYHNDSININKHDKPSFIEVWRQQMNVLEGVTSKRQYTNEWYTKIKKVCTINVYLDAYLMEKVYNYNIKKAIHELIILYGSLDFLYRIIDFYGVGKANHFGFQIAKITVDKNKKSDEVLSEKYVRFISSLNLGNDRCLGVSFTYQKLEGFIGKGFHGTEDSGIFIDNKDEIFIRYNWNVAYVNYMIPDTRTIRKRGGILNILAHEVGHIFGAVHEQETSCYRHNNLLMTIRMTEANRFDNFQFSKCNIKLMKKIIEMRIDKFVKCPHILSEYYKYIVYP